MTDRTGIFSIGKRIGRKRPPACEVPGGFRLPTVCRRMTGNICRVLKLGCKCIRGWCLCRQKHHFHQCSSEASSAGQTTAWLLIIRTICRNPYLDRLYSTDGAVANLPISFTRSSRTPPSGSKEPNLVVTGSMYGSSRRPVH